jgi:hypothetical protein
VQHVGDPFGAPVSRFPHEIECVEHVPVRAGGHQLQRGGHVEQGRPVRQVEPFQQRQIVVAVIGRHRFQSGGDFLDPALGVEGLQHRLPQLLLPACHAHRTTPPECGGRGGVAGAGDHLAQHPDQPLGFSPMRFPQLVQLVLTAFVHRRDPLAEHRHHVIAGLDPRLMHQARQQREPFRLTRLAHVIGIGDPCLTREMSDLRGRDTGKPFLGRADRVQHLQTHRRGQGPGKVA